VSQNLNALVAALESINKKDLELSIVETEQVFKKGVVGYVLQQNALVASVRQVAVKDVLTYADRYIASKIDADDPRDIFFNAAREVTNFVEYAVYGPTLNRAMTVKYRDLLPSAHPFSTKIISPITASALRVRNAAWVAWDPRITDENARKLVFQAYVSQPNSSQRLYAAARLDAITASLVPNDLKLGALTAAFGIGNPFAGNNSSIARAARAALQRRDRKGRFAEMGGGSRISALIGDMVRSFTGKFAGNPEDTNSVEVELAGDADLPAGIYSVPTAKVEGLKAILRTGAPSPDIKANSRNSRTAINLQDLLASRKTAPTGWEDNGDGTFTSADGYSVSTLASGQQAPAGSKFIGAGSNGAYDPSRSVFELKDDNGNSVGYAQEWANLQKLAADSDESKGAAPATKARLKKPFDPMTDTVYLGEDGKYRRSPGRGKVVGRQPEPAGFRQAPGDNDEPARVVDPSQTVENLPLIEPVARVVDPSDTVENLPKIEEAGEEVFQYGDPKFYNGLKTYGDLDKAVRYGDVEALEKNLENVKNAEYDNPQYKQNAINNAENRLNSAKKSSPKGVIKARADRAINSGSSKQIQAILDDPKYAAHHDFAGKQLEKAKAYEAGEANNPYWTDKELDDILALAEEMELKLVDLTPGGDPSLTFIKGDDSGDEWAEMVVYPDGSADLENFYVAKRYSATWDSPADADIQSNSMNIPAGSSLDDLSGLMNEASESYDNSGDEPERDYDDERDVQGFEQAAGKEEVNSETLDGWAEKYDAVEITTPEDTANNRRRWSSNGHEITQDNANSDKPRAYSFRINITEGPDAGKFYYGSNVAEVPSDYRYSLGREDDLEQIFSFPKNKKLKEDGLEPLKTDKEQQRDSKIERIKNNRIQKGKVTSAIASGESKKIQEALDDAEIPEKYQDVLKAQLKKAQDFENGLTDNPHWTEDEVAAIEKMVENYGYKGDIVPNEEGVYSFTLGSDEDYSWAELDIYPGNRASLTQYTTGAYSPGGWDEPPSQDVDQSSTAIPVGSSMEDLEGIFATGEGDSEAPEPPERDEDEGFYQMPGFRQESGKGGDYKLGDDFFKDSNWSSEPFKDRTWTSTDGRVKVAYVQDGDAGQYADDSPVDASYLEISVDGEKLEDTIPAPNAVRYEGGRSEIPDEVMDLDDYAGDVEALIDNHLKSKGGFSQSAGNAGEDNLAAIDIDTQERGNKILDEFREYGKIGDETDEQFEARMQDAKNALDDLITRIRLGDTKYLDRYFLPLDLSLKNDDSSNAILGKLEDLANDSTERMMARARGGFAQSAGSAGGVDKSHLSNTNNWSGDPSDGGEGTYTSPDGRLSLEAFVDVDTDGEGGIRDRSRVAVSYDGEDIGTLPKLGVMYDESDLANDVDKLVSKHLEKQTGGFNQEAGSGRRKVGNFRVIPREEFSDVVGWAETSDGGTVRLEKTADGTATPTAYNRLGEVMAQSEPTTDLDAALKEGERLLAGLEGKAQDSPEVSGFSQAPGDEPPAWTNDPASSLQYNKLQGILDNQSDKLPTDVRDMVEEAVANKALTKGEMGKLLAEVGKSADLSISYTPKIDRKAAANPGLWDENGNFTSADGRLRVGLEGDADGNTLSATFDGKPVDISPDNASEIMAAISDVAQSRAGRGDEAQALEKAVNAIDLGLREANGESPATGFAQEAGTPARTLRTPQPQIDEARAAVAKFAKDGIKEQTTNYVSGDSDSSWEIEIDDMEDAALTVKYNPRTGKWYAYGEYRDDRGDLNNIDGDEDLLLDSDTEYDTAEEAMAAISAFNNDEDRMDIFNDIIRDARKARMQDVDNRLDEALENKDYDALKDLLNDVDVVTSEDYDRYENRILEEMAVISNEEERKNDVEFAIESGDRSNIEDLLGDDTYEDYQDELLKALENLEAGDEDEEGFAQRAGSRTPKPAQYLDSLVPTEDGGMMTKDGKEGFIEVTPNRDGSYNVSHAYNYMLDEDGPEGVMDEGSQNFPTKEAAEAFANDKLEYYNSTDAWDDATDSAMDAAARGGNLPDDGGFAQAAGRKVSPEVSAQNKELAKRLVEKGAFDDEPFGGLDEDDPDYEALQEIMDQNEAHLDNLANTDPAEYFYTIASAGAAMGADPSEFLRMIEKPHNYHAEVLKAEMNNWAQDQNNGEWLDRIGHGSEGQGFAQKAGTKKFDPKAAIKKIFDAAPKDQGFAQRASDRDGLTSNGERVDNEVTNENWFDWASEWSAFSADEGINRLSEWWKWKEEYAQWKSEKDPLYASEQGIFDVSRLKDILDGSNGFDDKRAGYGWKDNGDGSFTYTSDTISIVPRKERYADGSFDYDIINQGSSDENNPDVFDTIEEVGPANSPDNLIGDYFGDELSRFGFEISGGDRNARNLFRSKGRGFAQEAGSDSALLSEETGALKLNKWNKLYDGMKDPNYAKYANMERDLRLQGQEYGTYAYASPDGSFTAIMDDGYATLSDEDKGILTLTGYIVDKDGNVTAKKSMRMQPGETMVMTNMAEWLEGKVIAENKRINKEKTGGFSAKQMEPATPAQYALLQEYADERVPADDVTAQAITEALANKNLTKAQMSALIGPMRDAGFKPGVDPNKPSDRALKSLNSKLVTKDLTPAEVKDILDNLPNMNRAEVDALNDKLRSKKDRPETIGFAQEPGGTDEDNMNQLMGDDLGDSMNVETQGEMSDYANSLKGDRVSELQKRVDATNEEINLFGLGDLQEMLDEADPDSEDKKRYGRTWPVEQSYIAAADLRDAAEQIRNSNNPNVDKSLATDLDNAADQVMKRMEDRVNPLLSASIAEAYSTDFDLGDVDTDLDQMRELYFETDTDDIKQYLDQTGIYGDVRSGGAEASVSDEPEQDGENKGKYRAFVSYGGGTPDDDQEEYFDDLDDAKDWAAREVSELNSWNQTGLTSPDKNFSDLEKERDAAIENGTEREFLDRLSDVAKMMRDQRGDEKLSWELDDYVDRARTALDKKSGNSGGQGFAQRPGSDEGEQDVIDDIKSRGQDIIDELRNNGKIGDETDETDEEFEARIADYQKNLDNLLFELNFGTGDTLERFGMRFDSEAWTSSENDGLLAELENLVPEARSRRSRAIYGRSGFAQEPGNAVVSPKMGESATDAQYDYLKELGGNRDGINPDLATAIQDALSSKNLTKAQMGALLGQLRALNPKAGVDTSKPTPRQLKRVKDLANSLGLSPVEKRKLGISNLSSKSADEIQQLIDTLKRRGANSPKA
jgi:hypothetical protein